MGNATLNARSRTKASRTIGFNEHLKFFDRDRDERISLLESADGLERLGFGHLLSIPGALIINFGLAGLGAVQGKPVNPANLELPRTGFVRHSDTELVDPEGNFDEARLDAVFRRYGRTFAGEALTIPELSAMVTARVIRNARNGPKELLLLPVGVPAVAFEWATLLWLSHATRAGRRVLEKETVRRFYTDPSFFDEVARRVAAEREARRKVPLGILRNQLQTWLL